MKRLAGTSISEQEGLVIIKQVQDLYATMNPLLRAFVPPLPVVLKKIPVEAREHTVSELIQLLEWATDHGLL